VVTIFQFREHVWACEATLYGNPSQETHTEAQISDTHLFLFAE